MDSYYRRALGSKNESGRKAEDHHRRWRTETSRKDVWDCNNRADVVQRDLEKRGVKSERIIEPTDNPKVNHVFIRAKYDDGSTEDILRYEKGD